MRNFIDKHNILHSFLYGFREAHCTGHVMLDIVGAVLNHLKLYFSCGIFIDLNKSFYTVNHKILLDKLNSYGLGH